MKSCGEVTSVLRANYNAKIKQQNTIIAVYDKGLADITRFTETMYKEDKYTIYKKIDEIIENIRKKVKEIKLK